MNRTFLYLLVAAVTAAWIGATERFLHIIPFVYYGRADPETMHVRELTNVLPITGAFLGAALVLALGVRRAAMVAAGAILLSPLLDVIDQLPHVAFYVAPITRRVFDVTLLALVASLVARQKEHRLAALLAFLLCRHAAIEIGVDAWATLSLPSLWARAPRITEAVCLAFAVGVVALVAIALRRTRESAIARQPRTALYRIAPPRVEEVGASGGFYAALPFAAGACVLAALVTLLGTRFSPHFSPVLGIYVLGAGAIATLAAWKRGTVLHHQTWGILGAIVFGAVAFAGALAAGLKEFPGSALCVLADLGIIVAVARTAITDRAASIAVLALIPAMEAFASMATDVSISHTYSFLLAAAAMASIEIPRRRAARAKLHA